MAPSGGPEKVESFPLAVKNGIEIAKALVSSESRILVMDEPTSALNAPEVERLFELIANLKTLGYGIIYISHKMEEIYQLADRITVLRDGAVVGTAKAKDLPKQELIRWMIGREMNDQFPRRGVPLPTESPERICVTGFSAPGVREVSFHVRAGEVLGLAGLQGSGNSELLNAVFGTYGRKVSGEVRLGGKRTPVRSPSHSIRSGLALLTNDRKATGLVLGMGIRENITLASMRAVSRGGWVSRKKERTRAEAMKRKLSIRATSIEQEAGALSGGNQQKVALAKWLETGPQVLFLDEPTRGVDVGAKHEIYELIHGLTEQGMAVVLITSEMPELLSLSDRIMVLHRGRVTAEFARGEATQENVLEAAMGFPETAASREAL
jgi:ribose transport system ATP-binding protein